MSNVAIPADVLYFLETVFAQCNLRVARKMSKMPTVHETSLDMTFIEELSNYSAPVGLGSGWTVRIDTHYLGGGRHFQSWEIADIGILVMFRNAGVLVKSKIALLQSKRLYPTETDFDEDLPVDYLVGFGRLYESEQTYLSVTEPRTFTFAQSSRYQAIAKDNDQYAHVEEFETRNGIPVHYMLYHPLRVPSSVRIPRTTTREPRRPNRTGCRVVRSAALREALGSYGSGHVPRYGELRVLLPDPYTSKEHEVGWRLEHFVARLLITCEEGYIARGRNDDGLITVFSRRGAPISAAIGITFDASEERTQDSTVEDR